MMPPVPRYWLSCHAEHGWRWWTDDASGSGVRGPWRPGPDESGLRLATDAEAIVIDEVRRAADAGRKPRAGVLAAMRDALAAQPVSPPSATRG
jgi:hypothetical protein